MRSIVNAMGILLLFVTLISPTYGASEKHALAVRYVELSGFKEQWEQMKSAMDANMQPAYRRAIERSGTEIPDEMKQELMAITSEEYKDSFTAVGKELKGLTAAFYSERLTEDELLELIEFHERPVHGKLRGLIPEVIALGTTVAQRHLEKTHRRLMDRIDTLREEFRDRR